MFFTDWGPIVLLKKISKGGGVGLGLGVGRSHLATSPDQALYKPHPRICLLQLSSLLFSPSLLSLHKLSPRSLLCFLLPSPLISQPRPSTGNLNHISLTIQLSNFSFGSLNLLNAYICFLFWSDCLIIYTCTLYLRVL